MRDDDLISRAKAADPAAWSELYRHHAARLVALLRVLNTADGAIGAEDLAAAAWLAAAEDIGGFSGTTNAFGGWLYTVAKRHGLRVRERALHRATPVAAGSVADLPQSTEGDWLLFAASEAEQIRSAAQWLAPVEGRSREVVACLDVLGWDVATTSQALGISRGAVRVARHRALTVLRHHWASTPSADG